MKSLTIAVLSDDPLLRSEFARGLGKGEKAEEDVAFYHSKGPEALLTVLEPARYPEKIHSLLYSLSPADYCVLVIRALNAAVGEAIVAIDAAGKRDGCILLSGMVPEQILPYLKGTLLESYRIFTDAAEARQAALSFVPPARDGPGKGIIDHSFEVKGVGMVALGFVVRGTIKVHDRLVAMPSGKALEIRSIQMQDDDYDSASAGDRFGISFKGPSSAKEISRGDVICPAGSVSSVKEAEVFVSLSPFSKKDIKDGEAIHAMVGLQFAPCRVAGFVPAGKAGDVRLIFDAPVALDGSDAVVLVRLNEKALRVFGKAAPKNLK